MLGVVNGQQATKRRVDFLERQHMYDLSQFGLEEMIECGAVIRSYGEGATSMEEVANRIVRYLYEHLGDKQRGTHHCVLVRFFKTHPFNELEPELKRYAQAVLGRRPASPTMKCFTLLATAGERPEWNDRTQSQRFKAIPIADHRFLAQFPMFSQLLAQFGVELRVVEDAGMDLLIDLRATTFNVFHVPEARDSPYVPCQEEFVIPFGVRSVLGFGAMLPSGELFAVILFAEVHISQETAEMFETIALCAKIAVLPFDGQAVFAHSSAAKRGKEVCDPEAPSLSLSC